MKKKYLLAYILLISISLLKAQEKGHYLYLNGGLGYHNLQYDLSNGTQQGGLGGTFNLGYNYFFTPHWGIGSGIGIQSFESLAKLNYMSGFSSIDVDDEAYVFRTYYNNWQETQNALVLDIPLGVSYKTLLKNKWQMQVSLGAKISLPLSAQYSISEGNIKTTGFYPQYNVELENLPTYGFDSYTTFPSKDITLKPIYSAFADIGALYALSGCTNLYLGGYINYGLNNAIDAGSTEVFQQGGIYNGVFASNQTTNVTPLSFGIKIGLVWELKSKKINPVVKPVETPIIETKPIEPIVAPQPVPVITEKQPEPVVEQKLEPQIEQKPEPQVVIAEPVKTDPYAEAKKLISGIHIMFVFNSSTQIIDESAQEANLMKLGVILKDNPTMKLRIIGRTCSKGDKKINYAIGMARASVLKNKLIAYGVNISQLIIESQLSNKPLNPAENSEINQAKNRRIDLILVE